jgi:hypothetical protein
MKWEIVGALRRKEGKSEGLKLEKLVNRNSQRKLKEKRWIMKIKAENGLILSFGR